jgi:predicted nucleic-acid-binding Zn-ribbon protein
MSKDRERLNKKLVKAFMRTLKCKHKNIDFVEEKMSFFKRRFHIDREKFIPVHCLDCGLLIPINKKEFK